MKKILVIDDNPTNNNIFISELKKYYSVDVAMYLVSATRLLKQKSYDLIILDVMMPTQNLNWSREMETGYYYYEHIIQSLNSNVPVLFWSRLYIDSFENYFHRDHSNNIYFLHKDSDDNLLINRVREIIGKKS